MKYVFDDVLEIKNGKNQKAVENPNGQYPIYGSGGVMGYADDYICEANSVIIGRKGSINNPIYVSEPFWNVDTAFGLVAKKELLIPKYLFYFCKWFDFEKLNKTVTIPSLTKSDLLKIEIDLPDIAEQQTIIEKLEKIETVLSLRKQELNVFEDLMRARFVEMFGSPIQNEKGWKVSTLSEVCKKITDGEHKNPEFTDKGVCMVMANNVREYGVIFDGCRYISENDYEKFSKKCKPEKGDVLLVSRGATIGRCCENNANMPFSLMGSVILMKNKKNIISSCYLVNWLKNEEIKPMIYTTSSASAQQAIYMKDLSSKKIILPPMQLQDQFATFVEQTNKSKVVDFYTLECFLYAALYRAFISIQILFGRCIA